MAYDAKVIEVMIASPSGVDDERKIVREVIAQWNDAESRERKVVLASISWDTHSSPDLSGRPQQLINDRVLSDADLVVGIFWHRIGSPTGTFPSGSVEEIQRHHLRGKAVMLYFSDVPAPPNEVDHEQFKQVLAFREWAEPLGIVASFKSQQEFRDEFRRGLPITLRQNDYLKGLIPTSTERVQSLAPNVAPFNRYQTTTGTAAGLSERALEVLSAACLDRNGMLGVRRSLAGTTVGAANVQFVKDSKDRREVARWEAVVDELAAAGVIRDINGNRELYEVTNAGFEVYESTLPPAARS